MFARFPGFSLTVLFLACQNLILAGTGPEMRELVHGNTGFACHLYQKLSTRQGNLFFSPFSISRALAMAYGGARRNTARQMSKTLQFSLSQEKLYEAFFELESELDRLRQTGRLELAIANSLWAQEGYPFGSHYIELIRKYYAGSVNTVDYRLAGGEPARQKINSWVVERTRKKITNILPPGAINTKTLLTLVNAIYFKSDWQKAFDRKNTKDAPFFMEEGKEAKTPLMYQEGLFAYGANASLQMLELPYADDRISMMVLLPREHGSLSEVEKALTPSNLELWRSDLRKTTVKVFLPKFRTTLGFSLMETLKGMGIIRDAFEPREADFSGMVDQGKQFPFFISEVVHKAFVDVSEEGTEAAASTAVTGMLISQALTRTPEIPVFRADHPFIFLIAEKETGSILFLGRMADPVQTNE
jgi:serpin B